MVINQITNIIQHVVFVFNIKRNIAINIKIVQQRNVMLAVLMLFLLNSVFRLVSKI